MGVITKILNKIQRFRISYKEMVAEANTNTQEINFYFIVG